MPLKHITRVLCDGLKCSLTQQRGSADDQHEVQQAQVLDCNRRGARVSAWLAVRKELAGECKRLTQSDAQRTVHHIEHGPVEHPVESKTGGVTSEESADEGIFGVNI